EPEPDRANRSGECSVENQRSGTCSGQLRSQDGSRFLSSHAKAAREELHGDSEREVRRQESRDALDLRNRKRRSWSADRAGGDAKEIASRNFARLFLCSRALATSCRRSSKISAATGRSARRT